MRDLLGGPNALARAAGVVDPQAVQQARLAVNRVSDAEEALQHAHRERDEAIGTAAAANPDFQGGGADAGVGAQRQQPAGGGAEPERRD